MAVALARRGVGPGAHVALLGPTSRPLVTAIQAIWLAGATVVVLPLPMRMSSLDDFVAQTRTRVRAADTTLVVADPMLAGFLQPEPGDPPVVLLADLTGDASDPWAWEAPKEDPSALAILQFTSGSTADPKGVMLPHATICANLDAIAAAAELDPAVDVLCSWLPLYHDMGLIGLLTLGMTTGTDLALASPQDFLAAPGRWMEWMSEHRATRHRRPQLLLRPGRPGPAPPRPRHPRPVPLADRPQRRRGRRPQGGGRLRGRRRAPGPQPRGGVPRLRHGRGDPGRDLPRARARACAPTPSTAGCWRPTPTPPRPTPTPSGTRHLVLLGRPVPGLEIRIVDPGQRRRPGRTGGRRAGDPGHLDHHRLLPPPRRHRGRLPRRLAPLRRPRLPGRRRAGHLRPHQGPHHRRAAATSTPRTSSGPPPRWRACGPATSSPSRSTGAGARRPSSWWPSRRIPTSRACGRRWPAGSGTSSGLPPEEVVLVEPGTLPKTSSGKLQRSLCRSRYLSAALSPR